MARIPVDPGRSSLPSVPSVRIPVADGIARGIEEIGTAISNVALESMRRDAKAEAHKILAGVRDDWSRRQLEMEQEAPLGAEGHVAAVEQAFDQDTAGRLETAPALARDWLTERINIERSRIVDRANVFEVTQRIEKRKQDTLDAIELSANAVRTDPAQFDGALLEAREVVDNAELSAETRAALRENADLRIAAARIQSLNETDPLEAKRILESDELDALLTPEAKHVLVNDNQVELRRREAARRALVAQAKGEIREVVDLLKSGFDPGPERLQRLTDAARGDEDLQDDLADAIELYEFQRGARNLTPTDLQSWINQERTRLNAKSGVEGIEAAKLQLAESLLSKMRTEFIRDPLSWAARVGTHQVAPLTLTGDGAEETMQQRKKDALAIAAYYGRPPRYLTDEEATQLAGIAEGKDLDAKLALVYSVSNGFGPNAAPQVFEEIHGKGAPTLAHAGGLALVGDQKAARDGLAGEQLLADKAVELPPASLQRETFQDMAGTAFALNPGARGRVEAFARDIYAFRAASRGLGNDKWDEDLWERSVQLAAGAVYQDGQRFGGIVEYNGRQVVAPREIAADQFGDVINALRDEDLAGAAHGDGTPIRAEELHDGFFGDPEYWLVSIKHGKYRIAVTDPALGRPDYAGIDGGTEPYVLDLLELLPRIRARTEPEAEE